VSRRRRRSSRPPPADVADIAKRFVTFSQAQQSSSLRNQITIACEHEWAAAHMRYKESCLTNIFVSALIRNSQRRADAIR
jgi:hypothetical protein